MVSFILAVFAIEPGQELLTQYAATGHNMYFTEIDEQNCFAAVKGGEADSKATNPYGLSENDYRAYFHMALRDSYMHQTTAEHQASVTSGNALPDEYQGYAY